MFACYSNLPAKPAEEAQKHRQQYEEMVAQAKKRGEVFDKVNNVPLLSSFRVFTADSGKLDSSAL